MAPHHPSMDIVFVSNADGSIAGKVKDFVHKIVRPSTYDCQLCAVSYGVVGMKAKWRTFVSDIDANVEFLHRDELRIEHASIVGAPLPAAWQRVDSGPWEVLVDSPSMRACQSLDDLISIMRQALTTRS